MSSYTLNARRVNLKDFIDVALNHAKVNISANTLEKVQENRESLERIIKEGESVYGITTGVGANKDTAIYGEEMEDFQENLIISHAVGMGDLLSDDIVRGMMFLRLNSLAMGYSGIRPEILHSLQELLNKDVIPVVPQDGSVGASGDLAPLAHIALTLIGKGKAKYKDNVYDSSEALRLAGIKPIKLKAKEGLALINGTQLMATYAAFLAYYQKQLFDMADLIASMSLEAGMGTPAAFDSRIHRLKPIEGQMQSASYVWRILKDSKICKSHAECGKVQDRYSFRCIPQVHGASRQGLIEKMESILTEMNSVTDNPLVFNDYDVLSGGNFHGANIARVLGEFKGMIAAIGAISEKRTSYLLDPKADNGLLAFLVEDNISSGYMLAQYVAAHYVAENSMLAAPVANITGIPTCADQEDHVSMGPIDGKYGFKILDNVIKILAIEYLCAAQALDIKEKILRVSPSKVTALARNLLRDKGVKYIHEDVELNPYLDTSYELVKSAALLKPSAIQKIFR